MTETTSNTLYCYVHPTRETSLRCKRCDKPICASCAQRTPTGYLCKDCVNQHKKIFDTALWYDYLLGFATTSILSFLAGGLLSLVSSFAGFFMIFISFAVAGGAGVFISNVTLRVTNRRRSRWLFITCAAGVVFGIIPLALYLFLTGGMYSIIMILIYVLVATTTVYARLAGIQL
ncbi:MAG: hypothetical protein HY863_14590 [Chloroflexi bacterium]|nr:hypothetical protein [Chloroflexota bacterium]